MAEPDRDAPGPAIAVLPFDSAGDTGQEYFARGFVEDVVTELTRFPTLEVIHPASASALESADRPPARRPAFFVCGTVRRAGDVVRVGARLVEASSRRQVWADRFDAPAEGLLAVQDQIVARIVTALASRIDTTRLQQARRKPLASLEVYDCWLRGVECLHRGTVEDDARARTFFARALDLDPHFARAYAGLSLSHFNEWSCQAWERWDDNERRAFDYARRAAEADDRDAFVQLVLGRILAYRRHFDEAARHLHRAVELNPNDSDVLAHAALCGSYLGDHSAAAERAAKAMRLHPAHPDWYLACAAFPLFFLGRYEETVTLISKVPHAFVDMPALLAASHAFVGDAGRAGYYLEMFHADFVEKITFGRAPEPGEPLRWLLHVNPLRHREDEQHLTRGLRLAGLPADPDEGAVRAIARPVGERALPTAIFRRDGALWSLAFEGLVVRLTDVKGFHDLATLLAEPGRRIHCLDLAGRSAEPRGDAPLLDERARRELAGRARELQEDIDEAEALNDRGRAERAREELDRLVSGLSRALGLGGRSRRLGSAAERGRTAVTWRIRSAIRKIGEVHPALGRHLERGIRTGTYCEYSPERPVDWEV
jgi:TolB-like protein